MASFVLFGDIIYLRKDHSFALHKDSYLVCKDDKVKGVYKTLKEEDKDLTFFDYKGKLILPGFYDLHLHASQYPFAGTNMDEELLPWLDKYAFPQEAKYASLSYAKKAYPIFVKDLKKSFTCRASIFATLHKNATVYLATLLEESGLICKVGLVNMDRNSPDYLREKDVPTALKDTEEAIEKILLLDRTEPIITPRFAPSCTDELLLGLGKLRKKYSLAVQSHLDENQNEVAFVKELFPHIKNYSEVYETYGLFGKDHPCIMAHCLYNNEEELELAKRNNVYFVHCPDSNTNVSSGIAPIKKYLEEGRKVALGSDVSGGSNLNMLRHAALAIQMSKMYAFFIDKNAKPLTLQDAFYLLTLGGGSFFGKCGSFLKGYDFDCLVIDDDKIRSANRLTLKERLERLLYQGETSLLIDKFVKGRQIKL